MVFFKTMLKPFKNIVVLYQDKNVYLKGLSSIRQIANIGAAFNKTNAYQNFIKTKGFSSTRQNTKTQWDQPN